MIELAARHCTPCTGDATPLTADEAGVFLKSLRPEWKLAPDAKSIEATFKFKDYYRTTAFVNAVVFVAHREDHHPDVSFGYNTCTVKFWTHAVNGLTDNDFICAAKVDGQLR